MTGITFDVWKSICHMYSTLPKKYCKAYIQWFPFSLLSSGDWEFISSKDFFTKYIQNGAFVFSPQIMYQSDNYMLKSDGSFREASLLSPILYLILQSIGKNIFGVYSPMRPNDVSVYYSGSYSSDRPYYKKDYDAFYKDINSFSDTYEYFIKTDVQNFFSNINLDILISHIDSICNNKQVVFSQAQLQMYKEFLLYCGKRKFPLVENSIASSYLATVVYLDEVDCKISEYITNKIPVFSKFKMFRYVDDLYICFSSPAPKKQIEGTVQDIRDAYSSILKEYNLTLNSDKFCWRPMAQIKEVLKDSFYDEYVNGVEFSLSELVNPSIRGFLQKLNLLSRKKKINREEYNQCIEESFRDPSLEYSPTEIFNHCIYGPHSVLSSPEVNLMIKEFVEIDKSCVLLDPKRLTIMVLKSENEGAIKGLLNYLFERNRTGRWNSYHTAVAITYCIQRRFKHVDLLAILKKQAKLIYQFYQQNCKQNFLNILQQEDDSFCKLFSENITCLLYFMSCAEKEKNNMLASFAYFKNFFDRATAILASQLTLDRKKKGKLKIQKYYTESHLKKFYREITDGEDIIEQVHKLRNNNPLAHASAGLWEKETRAKDLQNIIESLQGLLQEKIARHSATLLQ